MDTSSSDDSAIKHRCPGYLFLTAQVATFSPRSHAMLLPKFVLFCKSPEKSKADTGTVFPFTWTQKRIHPVKKFEDRNASDSYDISTSALDHPNVGGACGCGLLKTGKKMAQGRISGRNLATATATERTSYLRVNKGTGNVCGGFF